MVSEKVIREGVYGEYEMEVPQQVYDDARSTYKTAKETKSKKGMLTFLYISVCVFVVVVLSVCVCLCQLCVSVCNIRPPPPPLPCFFGRFLFVFGSEILEHEML